MFTNDQNQSVTWFKNFAQEIANASLAWGSAVSSATTSLVQNVAESEAAQPIETYMLNGMQQYQKYCNWMQDLSKGYTK